MAANADYGVTTFSRAAAGEQLPTLPVVLAYVQACGGDLEDWEERWRQTAAEEAAEPRADDDAEPPYRGLARFEPSDVALFFGRDQLIDDLVHLTGRHRITAVVGASGSGKSSLLRAGLIPRLRTTDNADLRPAALRVITPGGHPLRDHEQRLVPKEGEEGDTWLVVDQMEELYTLCADPEERAAFIDRLLTATFPGSRLRVLIAVRADFFGHLAGHRALADALREATLLVAPMNRDELREAVVKPAQAAGLIVERTLTARIIDEVDGEPGALPLMSHALLETWHRRKGRALTLTAYEAAGGVHGAIAQTAEDLYTHLTPPQAARARRTLLRLITPGDGAQDTRRPAPQEELETGTSSVTTEVLERLVKARLVILDGSMVHLAHEALITAWPRLGGWIEEDRERLRAHRQLTEAARAWDDVGRDPGALYRSTRLATAEEQFGAPEWFAALTALERAFLAASRTARAGEARRRWTLASALALLLVLALIAGVIAWQQGRTNDRRHVEAEARRIAAVADSMRFSDPVKAMRLSVAAWRLADTLETRSALLGAATQKEQDVFAVPGADSGLGQGTQDQITERHLTADGRTVISIAPDLIQTWDLRTHRRTNSAPGLGKRTGDGFPVLSPDGRTLAQLLDDKVRLWDTRGGRITGTLPGVETFEASFGPSGRTLVADAEDTGRGRSVQVWDVRSRHLLIRVPMPGDDGVQSTAVSANDRWLALCTDKRPVEIWDIAERRKMSVPWSAKAGHDACSHGFAFAPDGPTMALLDGTGIRRWDFRSGRQLPLIEEEELDGAWFSPDGAFLAALGTHKLVVWRLSAPHTPVFRYANEESGEFALDLAAGAVRYLNGSGTVVRSLRLGQVDTGRWEKHPTSRAELTEDGQTLAVLYQPKGSTGRYRLLDTRSGRVISELPGAPCPTAGSNDTQPDDDGGLCTDLLAFSADGRYFAYGQGWDTGDPRFPERRRIMVWDVEARRRHATIEIRPQRGLLGALGIVLSADGRTLVVLRKTLQESVEVWEVRQEKRIRTLLGGPSPGSDLNGERLFLRHDANMLVSGGGSVADLRSGRMSHRVLGDNETRALAFSPNGAYLAVGDTLGRVTLWDAGLRERLGLLSGPSAEEPSAGIDEVSALAFSADSSLLAVADSDGTVQLWDVASRQLLDSALPTPGDPVLSLAFGPNGRTLYVAGTHVPLQKYDLTSTHLAKQACERAGGGLSKADWKRYLPDLPFRSTC